MTKKKLYSYLASTLTVLLLLCFYPTLKAQIPDSAIVIESPLYTLEEALKQPPLQVYKLTLRKNNLSELPHEIFQFKNLCVLNISKNNFTVFPKSITKFKYLQELDISKNKIKTVPNELGELIYLKKLYARKNIIDTLPSSISNLKNLVFIDLRENNIHFLPNEISELTETLKEVKLEFNLTSMEEEKKIKSLLPKTVIHFIKVCDCDF